MARFEPVKSDCMSSQQDCFYCIVALKWVSALKSSATVMKATAATTHTDLLIKRGILSILISLFIVCSLHAQDELTPAIPDSLEWRSETVTDGILWKQYSGDLIFDSKQNINLIEIDLMVADVRLRVVYDSDTLQQTSNFARKNDALAALNGTFYNRSDGEPIVFLKIDSKIIYDGQPARDLYIENGALAFDGDSNPAILQRPAEGWKTVPYETVLSAGPLLIHDGQIQAFYRDPFNQNRHPRTAVGLTNDGRLYLVTIDGRSFQAYGMTIPELARFLSDLGMEDALNLDGGGSTSMWIDLAALSGIVNNPSDNLKFDHEGERKISNALLIIRNSSEATH